MQQLHTSARACHRILKLAQTIADLAGSDETLKVRLTEAPESGSRHSLSGNASYPELAGASRGTTSGMWTILPLPGNTDSTT
jgi:hypothetical protein